MSACLSPNELLAYPQDRARIEKHCAECDLCRASLAALADVATALVADRYELEERLGAGASAEVWRAHDTKLRRKVAIKVLHERVARVPAAGARMIREAQVLAQLSHSAVLRVYDSGWHGERPFIVMELQDAGTLTQWLAAGRSSREVIARFIEAGEGLAAAHDAGIIHRDFKPANVLITASGHAQVADFGLASPPLSESAAVHATSTLTESGLIMGTPAYMAPEQLLGRPADARTDQFAFCVALYEALTRKRPFVAENASQAIESMRRGARSLPLSVRAVLERGLAFEPEDRFADMHALVRALHSALKRRTRVALTATLIALSLIAWRLSAPPSCDNAMQELNRSFGASKLGASAPVTRRVSEISSQWTQSWQQVCQDTRSPHTQLRYRCLRQVADHLRLASDVFTQRSDITVFDGVPDARDCEQITETSATPWMSGVDDAYASQLTEVSALRGFEDEKIAEQKTLALIDHAQKHGLGALEAEASLELGLIRYGMSRVEDSSEALRSAALLAEKLGLDALRMRALYERAQVVGPRLGNYALAHELLWQADALAQRFKPQAPRDELEYAHAVVLNNEGKRKEAEAHYRRSLAIQRELKREGRSLYLETMLGLARSLLWQRHSREAIVLYEQIYALYVERVGERHKILQRVTHDLARAYDDAGKLDKAHELLQRASHMEGANEDELLTTRIADLYAQHRMGVPGQVELLRELMPQAKSKARIANAQRILAIMSMNRKEAELALTLNRANYTTRHPGLLKLECLLAPLGLGRGLEQIYADAEDDASKACAAAGLALKDHKWAERALQHTEGADTADALQQRATALTALGRQREATATLAELKANTTR